MTFLGTKISTGVDTRPESKTFFHAPPVGLASRATTDNQTGTHAEVQRVEQSSQPLSGVRAVRFGGWSIWVYGVVISSTWPCHWNVAGFFIACARGRPADFLGLQREQYWTDLSIDRGASSEREDC